MINMAGQGYLKEKGIEYEIGEDDTTYYMKKDGISDKPVKDIEDIQEKKKKGSKTKIAIGSDHAGLPLKEEIIKYFKEKSIDYIDYGTNSSDSVDYSDYGKKVAYSVKDGECEKGIVICGTGIGISIAANKVKGIRAALCTNSYMAKMTRLHNDSNVLALGQRVIGVGLALEIVETWLNTKFEGGRHQRRIDKIKEIENE